MIELPKCRNGHELHEVNVTFEISRNIIVDCTDYEEGKIPLPDSDEWVLHRDEIVHMECLVCGIAVEMKELVKGGDEK